MHGFGWWAQFIQHSNQVNLSLNANLIRNFIPVRSNRHTPENKPHLTPADSCGFALTAPQHWDPPTKPPYANKMFARCKVLNCGARKIALLLTHRPEFVSARRLQSNVAYVWWCNIKYSHEIVHAKKHIAHAHVHTFCPKCTCILWCWCPHRPRKCHKTYFIYMKYVAPVARHQVLAGWLLLLSLNILRRPQNMFGSCICICVFVAHCRRAKSRKLLWCTVTKLKINFKI